MSTNGLNGPVTTTTPVALDMDVPRRFTRSCSKSGERKFSLKRFSLFSSKTNATENGGVELYDDDQAANIPYLSAYLQSWGGVAEEPSSSGHGGKTKLGILLGVYLPSIQHILGVQMFLRLLWVVGIAGILESVLMVFVCCLCTFLTSISMSAIATNGKIESGGAYFMISRNLGPEFGGAIGILFYLANTIATSMYLVGGVEILLTYMAPGLPQFGPEGDEEAKYNNFRLYGTAFLIVVFLVCAGGVRLVQLFGPISLTAVILSILAVFIGSFVANPNRGPMICMLGDRLILHDAYFANGTAECTKNESSRLWKQYCDVNGTCDPHFINSDARYVPGIPGFANGMLSKNAWPVYLEKGESSPEIKGDDTIEVTQDMSTDWFVLLAIFFPSVTGIMTGANMSGDLKDPQTSIPIGTIAAQLTTSFIYLLLVICYGGVIEGPLLRDKYGESMRGSMLVAQLAWPNEWVLLIGSFLACIGAGLQCLCSAPRLLQSIAKDDLIPFLGVFRCVTKRGEPFKALLITALLAECAVLIGTIDYIAPVVDFFFLMSYCAANIACTLQTLLRAPNWRPRFKYYHWTLSLLGALLCLFIMFTTYWYYGVIVVILCGVLYKCIEYKGAKKEWGDGMRGLALSTAQFSLLKAEGKTIHAKNWRPQILVLLKLGENSDSAVGQRLLNLAGQLKASKGLTMVASILQGDIGNPDDQEKQAMTRYKIRTMMKEAKVKGFVEAVLAENASSHLASVIQCVGMGALRPNTLILAWPNGWQQCSGFCEAIRCAAYADMCLLLPKGLETYPELGDQLSGTIDVWWIMHDGGLLILLPFLLKQHKVWKGCKMRVFAVAQVDDNVIKMKEDLQKWVYNLRIDCAVDVITLPDSTVYAYTNERTLMIAERIQLASEMQLNAKDLSQEPQMLADVARYGAKLEDYFPEKPPRSGSLLQSIFSPADDSSPSDTVGSQTQEHPNKNQPEKNATIRPTLIRPKSLSPTEPRPTLLEILANGAEIRRQSMCNAFKNPAFEPEASADAHGESLGIGGQAQRKCSEIAESIEEEIEPPKTKDRTQLETQVSNIEEYIGRFSITSHQSEENIKPSTPKLGPRREEDNNIERKMQAALRLNKAIKEQSIKSRLVILNLPRPPGAKQYFHNYMQYLEALTKDLQRVLLVRGSGKEVVTIYS